MTEEQHDEEIRRQAKAEVGAGKVVPGSGRRGKPRRMAQMVSVRLDGELIGKLRLVARERNVTISDLLREGAELIVQETYVATRPKYSYTVSGADEAVSTVVDRRAFAVNCYT